MTHISHLGYFNGEDINDLRHMNGKNIIAYYLGGKGAFHSVDDNCGTYGRRGRNIVGNDGNRYKVVKCINKGDNENSFVDIYKIA